MSKSRVQILKACHNDPTAGHHGILQTLFGYVQLVVIKKYFMYYYNYHYLLNTLFKDTFDRSTLCTGPSASL